MTSQVRLGGGGGVKLDCSSSWVHESIKSSIYGFQHTSVSASCESPILRRAFYFETFPSFSAVKTLSWCALLTLVGCITTAFTGRSVLYVLSTCNGELRQRYPETLRGQLNNYIHTHAYIGMVELGCTVIHTVQHGGGLPPIRFDPEYRCQRPTFLRNAFHFFLHIIL